MRRTSWFSIGLALLLLTQSSRLDHSQSPVTPPQAQEKPAPPTPMAEQKAELGDDETWDPDWDKIIEDALPSDLLSSKVSKDVKNFCPRFSSLQVADKRAYLGVLLPGIGGSRSWTANDRRRASHRAGGCGGRWRQSPHGAQRGAAAVDL